MTKKVVPRDLALATRPRAEYAEFTLETPPSTNKLTRNLPSGGRAKTRDYKNWIEWALWEIKLKRVPLVPGRVRVSIVVDQKRRMDLDNVLKPLMDLLVRGYVIEDDKNVVRYEFEWGDTQGCAVTVSQRLRRE